MKKYFVLAASAAVVLGSSCSNEEISEVTALPENGKKAIEISAYTPGLTRYDAAEATRKNLEEYDEVLKPNGAGFYMTAKYMANDKNETLMNNVHFYVDSTDVDGKCFVAEDEQTKLFYWPEELEGNVNFYAYYVGREFTMQPCTLNVDGGVDEATMNINFNAEDRGNIDVMVASQSASTGNVGLDFKHVMAQVVVNVNYDAEYVGDLDANNVSFVLTSLTLTAPSSSTYKFSNNEITAGGEYTYSFMAAGASETITENEKIGTVMIPASSGADGSACSIAVGYTVQIDGNEKSYSKSKTDGLKIIAGYKNIINVTLSGSKPISVSATVAEWQSGEDTPVDF